MNQELIVSIPISTLHCGQKADWRQTSLYVENFGEGYDEKQLKGLFVSFGNINSWEMTYLKDTTGRSRWVGFVSYESYNSVSTALAAEELNDKVTCILPLNNWMACLEQLLQGEELSQVVTVRVMNLDERVNDAQLREKFARCGNITSAKVHMYV